MTAENTITLNGKTYPVEKVKLHVPKIEGYVNLYLSVFYNEGQCGFALWDLPLLQVPDIEHLSGCRIHLNAEGESCPDDTSGADIILAQETSDLNYFNDYPAAYSYGEILADFARIEDNRYRVQIRMTLSDDDEEGQWEEPEEYPNRMEADLVVTADEWNPYE